MSRTAHRATWPALLLTIIISLIVSAPAPVSYTHLDVYKRQTEDPGYAAGWWANTPVSYTHLDVYKRQHPGR